MSRDNRHHYPLNYSDTSPREKTRSWLCANPVYEIASPLYEHIEINLNNQYGRRKKFTIFANGASRKNKYIQSATLNGKKLTHFYFPASELLKGGKLELIMGEKPNKRWGVK